MAVSQNEIEVMGKRAARGAGLSWGLAEEAGKTARWLSSRGLPGPEQLAEILTRNDGKPYVELAPVSLEGVWCAPSDRLCPLITGAVLCDHANRIAGGVQIKLGPVAQPLLLAPYAAAVAKMTNTAVELAWGDTVLIFTADGYAIEGDGKTLTARKADGVLCRRVCDARVGLADYVPGRSVDAETWGRLAAFAQRTFAPATEASRLTGAGARLIDND